MESWQELTRMEYKGHVIVVGYDPDPCDPRDWDNIGTIYSNHRDYDPDRHRIDELMDEEGNIALDDYIYVKVWAYIHSGIALSTSRAGRFNDPWDSGLFGIIAVRRDDGRIRNMDGEAVIRALEDEIRTLDDYYNGNVLCFEVMDRDGDIVDSCYGYYGVGEEYPLGDAKAAVDWIVEHERVAG